MNSERRRIHDYRRGGWGRRIAMISNQRSVGTETHIDFTGWGRGIEEGHEIIATDGVQVQAFRVVSIEYKRDPKDMWSATVEYIGTLEHHEIQQLDQSGDYLVAA